MRKSLTLLLLALAVWGMPATAAAETGLTASVDKTAVAPGERFTLTLAFSGTRDVAAPDLGALPDFKAHYIGPITRMQSSNSRVDVSISHRYLLTAPQRSGRYKIGPLRIVLDGHALQTEAIAITVGASNQAAGSDRAEIELQVIPDISTPWVGQRIPVIVRLRVGNARVDDLNYPQISAAGATIEEFAKPSRRDEWDEGRRFQILDFRTTVTPLKAGRLKLEGVTMDMTVLDPSTGSRRNAIFDDFFSRGRSRSLRLQADSVELDVQALPSHGKSADFSGAIGTFEFQVEAGPTELSVGDPITLRTQIRGVGNLESIEAPAVPESDGFRVYEPTLVSGDRRTGAVTFEQVLIPKIQTVGDIPSLSFTFFDPHDGEYRVSRSAPIPIDVGQAAPQHSGIVSSELESRIAPMPAELGKDIVYIKERPGQFRTRSVRRVPNIAFLAMQGIPVLLFLVSVALVRRRTAMFADPHARRARQSGAVARKRLKAAPSGTPDELTEIVAEYLNGRLGLPPGRIDMEHVLRRLEEIGAGTGATQAVTAFFTAVDSVRYGGTAADMGSHATARSLAEAVVTSLEKDLRVTKSALSILALVLCLVSVAASAQTESDFVAQATDSTGRKLIADPMEAFFLGNGAYAEGDYLKAEQAYRSALETGTQSAPLYFNLGNAYFKQGRIGFAIAAYESSLRLAPRDPDVAANIQFARDAVGIEKVEAAATERYLTPLATRMSAYELTTATLLFWWLAWILATVAAAIAGTRAAMKKMAIAAAVLFVLFAANLAVRSRHTVWQQWVVITATGQTAVRFEPSPEGTEHFSISEGGMLEARRSRKGWIQVRRADGRRGWIPASSAEHI